MRGIAAICLVLTACTVQQTSSPADTAALTPVDIATVQRTLLAASPDAAAFSAFSPAGKGVVFALDGTATYVDPAIGQRVETTVSGFTDNTMCVAEAGDWPGLCIDLYQDSTGAYICEGTFGDGTLFTYPCALTPVARNT
jgi:hypothetical protein